MFLKRRLIDWNIVYLRNIFQDNVVPGIYCQYEKICGIRFEQNKEILGNEQFEISKNNKPEPFFEAFKEIFPEGMLQKVAFKLEPKKVNWLIIFLKSHYLMMFLEK